MSMRLQSFVLILGAAGLLMTGCAQKSDEPVVVEKSKLVLFKPLPELMPAKSGPPTEDLITLGRVLYYEKRLSKDQNHSCNSCHNLQTYGVDNKPTSGGFKGQLGDRNSPSVYNAAGHFVQFWDGRAADVEEQAKGPVLNPVEMALPDAKSAESVLKSMPEYVDMFKKAFPGEKDPVTFENMAKAIGAFERKLTTPSRWDKYLAGDETALTNEEKKGFLKFVEAGCQTCHAGTLVGGNLYQKLGAAKEFPDQSDPGRMKVTKAEADKMVFKVPSLRNIEKTGPYYHNGKVTSLEEATSMMAELQLGKTLKPEEVASIVTWMKTLTGEIPVDYIKEPPMPKSTPKTPKPVTAD